MPSIMVKKSNLQSLVGYEEVEDLEVVHDEIWDHRRWVVVHRLIFKKNNKLYETTYNIGATESQDESPFEYEPDEISCQEVREIQIKGYEVIKDA